MKIGNDTLHYMERIAWSNHNLRISMQSRQIVTIKIIENLFQSLKSSKAIILLLIWHPLGDTQLIFRCIGTLTDDHTYIL